MSRIGPGIIGRNSCAKPGSIVLDGHGNGGYFKDELLSEVIYSMVNGRLLAASVAIM